MNLTESHIDRIASILHACGIADGALHDDLLDHICTVVENSTSGFEEALGDALKKFGGEQSLTFLQRQTRIALQHRQKVRLERMVHRAKFAFGFFAVIAIAFKTMHWPYGTLLVYVAAALGLTFFGSVLYRQLMLAKMEKLTT